MAGGLNSEMFTFNGRPEFMRTCEVLVDTQYNGLFQENSVRLSDIHGRVAWERPVSVSSSIVHSRHQCVDKFPWSEKDSGGSVFFYGCDAKILREAPIWLYKHCMAARAMAQYYLAIRGSKRRGGFDLNSVVSVFDGDQSVSVRNLGRQMLAVRTPLELGQRNVLCSIDGSCALEFINKIHGCVDMSRYVFFIVQRFFV